MPTAQDLTPYQVYSKVADNFSRTVIFLGVAGFAVWWMAGWWHTGAVVLFGIGAVMEAFDALQVLALTGAGVVGNIAARREGATIEGERWMWAANAVRVAQSAIGIVALILIFHRLW